MSALLDLQRAFGRRVLGLDRSALADVIPGAIGAAERLSIYRNTVRTTLTEALRLSFPAVDVLVGPEFFDMAAARFVQKHAPTGGCLNDYGAAFPAFLSAMPETGALPYLNSVARFEWALAEAAIAPDVPVLDLRRLADDAASAEAPLSFAPHPSVRLLALDFPGDRIADAVLANDDEALRSIDVSVRPCWLVVHRGVDGVVAERIGQAAFDALTQLFAGVEPDRIAGATACLVGHLLAEQIVKGRVVALQPWNSEPGE